MKIFKIASRMANKHVNINEFVHGEKINNARELIANYAKHENIKVNISPYGATKDKPNNYEKLLIEIENIATKKKKEFVILADENKVMDSFTYRYNATKTRTTDPDFVKCYEHSEDTFLRNLYKKLEMITKQVKLKRT